MSGGRASKKSTNSSSPSSSSSSVMMATPPTTTLPPPKPNDIEEGDLHYSYTSDYSSSALHETLEDANEADNHGKTSGPFGFGVATSLQSNLSQCLQRRMFVPISDECVYSPKDCPNGLSFSIWERPYIHDNILDPDSDFKETRRYIVSTGGDDSGHPGIALYHNGHWLTAVVSTGLRYWKVSSLAAVVNGDWNNVGVRWTDSDGMKVYVNMTLVAQASASRAAETGLEGLSPPEIIFGCHRDVDDRIYRDFFNGDLDEFAFWERSLDESELDFFYGGFKDNISAISSQLLTSYLPRLDMGDPDQANAVASVLDVLSETGAEPTEATSTAHPNSGVSSTATSPTTGNHLTTPKANPASVEDLRNVAEFTSAILDPKLLPAAISEDNLEKYMKVSKGINNLADPSKGSAWLAIQDQREGTPGIMQIIDQFLHYNSELIGRTSSTGDSSDPFCKRNNRNNLLLELCKTRISDLRAKKSPLVKPDYHEMYEDLWDSPYDKVKVSPWLYEDSRCFTRSVSVTTTVYNSVSSFVDRNVNTKSGMNADVTNEIDSRLISFNISADRVRHPDGTVDTSHPLCTPNLRARPVTVLFEHRTPVVALRKVLFHEHEIMTDIDFRMCVWWNSEAGDGGAWDNQGCRVVRTTPEHTECACDKFGTFAIMAKKTEEKTVPEEPEWLPMVSNILYLVSGIALLIYIFVVILSGDLKDQFHLMGLNLAACILLGSGAMVLSDIEAIKSDRHTCVAMGTLIHFAYGAVGFWMLSLGHASFKAIISGVIGGRLRCYMAICWGSSLICVGVPLAGYLHELGTDPRCFIGWPNEVKLIFFLPQTFCSIVACFYAVVILVNLKNTAIRKKTLRTDYGSFSGGAAVLLLVLSATWMVGVFAYMKFSFNQDIAFTLFQLMNSVSGLCLLLCLGLGSSRFRSFVTGQAKKRRQNAFDEDRATLVDPNKKIKTRNS